MEKKCPFLRTNSQLISLIGYIIYTFGGLCQNMKSKKISNDQEHESLTDLKLVQTVYIIYHCVRQEQFYLKIAQYF